jgi:hypothetical protein
LVARSIGWDLARWGEVTHGVWGGPFSEFMR